MFSMLSIYAASQQMLLEICYLFTYSDGNSSSEEMTLFQSICREMDVDQRMQDTIIRKYSSDTNITYEYIVGKITQFLDADTWTKSKQAELIWDLVNIGYADKDFSENERKIISFIVEQLKFSKTTLDDYIDTSETMLMLTNEKEWIKTTDKSYDEINAKITKIDEFIKKLGEKIKADIYEIEIA